MTDALDLLRADHADQQAALRRLRAMPHHKPDEGLAVHQATSRLIAEASGHEAIEETWFWPAVRRQVAGGDELADAAIEQERQAKWLLHEIGMRVPEDDGFDDLLGRFADLLEEHIAYEEHTVFPRVAEALSTDELDRLGQALASERRRAPTRPHPAGPDHAGGLRTMGRLTGLADRALDLITGRNADFGSRDPSETDVPIDAGRDEPRQP